MQINPQFKTFEQMIKDYPNIEDDLRILRNNINAKAFWCMLVVTCFNLSLGVVIGWLVFGR
jgi:hypothetical protein